jgi:branched-chain amino acid transport system permease protein
MNGIRKIGTIIVILLVSLIPFFIKSGVILHYMIFCFIWCIASTGLNIIAGYTGRLNFGIIAFFGIGAYSSALLMMRVGLSFWIAFPLAGAITALVGFLVGIATIRIKEMQFAIFTLVFGLMMFVIFQSWESVTGGTLGLPGIPAPVLGPITFNSSQSWYFLAFAIFLITTFFTYYLVKSRIGRTLISIREDEILATAFGANTAVYKILAFTISCFIAGLGGSLYAHYLSFISPDSFTLDMSFEIIIYTFFGGAGTVIGPLLGTFFLRGTLEVFRVVSQYRLVAYGVLILLILKYMSEGIYPYIKRQFYSLRTKFGKQRRNKTLSAESSPPSI